jgi:hypothetical protein
MLGLKTYEVLLNPEPFASSGGYHRRRPSASRRASRRTPTKARSGLDVKPLAGTSHPKLYRLRVGVLGHLLVDEERR